ncbi:MAG: MBL fold metallo-hydrolase [Evtepia sp.]
MNLTKVKGNTFFLEGRQHIPLYQLDEHHCILMDPGRADERTGIEEALQEAQLVPVGVMISHMHYDHHENTRYFKEKYKCQSALARQDAELCRDLVSLRNHLYTFTPGLLEKTPRLQNLICDTDYCILPSETSIEFMGATFGILHTPGHSPSHICITTPDDVCFVGDCLMTDSELATAKVPFVFDLAQDIKSKEKLMQTHHAAYLFSHQGIETPPLDRLTKANMQLIDTVLALFLRVVSKPMMLSDIYGSVSRQLGLASGHPMRAFYLERYLRPYLDYLIDEGKLVYADGNGAPTLAPAEDPA